MNRPRLPLDEACRLPMQACVPDLPARLPGPASAKWPDGERSITAFAHGTMSVESYAPRGDDPQAPHAQDELYFIPAGHGGFHVADATHAIAPGDYFLVAAGIEHRFVDSSDDFAAWVVFSGPQRGE